MKNNKFYKFKEKIIVYIVMVVLSGTIFYYNRIIGVISFLLTLYLAFFEAKVLISKEKELELYIENFNEQFDEITRRAIFSMPFSLVILNEKGKIKWYNNKFKNIVSEEEESLINADLNSIFSEIDIDEINCEKEFIEIFYENRFYKFYINIFGDENSEKNILLYGVDYSEEFKLSKDIINNSLAVIWINIDNYDELYENTEDNHRPMVFAEIDKIINNFAQGHEGYSIKYEQDNYAVIVSYENLVKAMDAKFNILDEVRDLDIGNTISATLSIGVGTKESTPADNYKSAKACINIALGRGGDQAVVKIDDHYEYFGGKKQSATKSSTVKARVMANGLGKLMEQGGDVFIMGHKNPDMDSIGSCLGILEMATRLEKNCYIVLEKVTPAIKKIYESVIDNHPDENIENKFIKPDEAEFLCQKDSTVVVLDHHRKIHSEGPKLLELSENIILIDHHRRGGDYIDNAVLTYLEPHASSTSELVTEILFYLSDKMKIPKVVAEGLLAGITVDTKNFTLQTGVRTFEAASILKRQGADSIAVKELFKDSINTVRLKGEVVYNSKIYKKRIAIGVLKDKVDESILIAAQSADELLNIDGIEASFVLTKASSKIHISGRSLGEISVQLILEKLDGGGHLTSAGAQVEGTMENALSELERVIDEYLEEDNNSESNINR